jgi:SsrA-binding protein
MRFPMEKEQPAKVFARNRKAQFDFHIEERFEAGIALTGTEVKSIRQGRANLRDSYADIEGTAVVLRQCHISPYEAGNRFNHDPLRPRRLLLHRAEIQRLFGKVKEKGLTLIPLSLYQKGRRIKVELGLARGKKGPDRREEIKRRTAEREMEQARKAGSR